MLAPKWRQSVPGSTAVLLLASSVVLAQGSAPASGGEDTPTSITRTLVAQQAFTQLAAKGKAKRDIKTADPTFAMADGQSRVALFKLPEFKTPYVLTLKSYLYKHAFSRTEQIFVPTTVVLDDEFVVTRTLPETVLQWKPESMTKGPRLEIAIPFTDPQKNERFLLVYTKGNTVGEPTRKQSLNPAGGVSGALVDAFFVKAETAAEGNIEAETGPAPER